MIRSSSNFFKPAGPPNRPAHHVNNFRNSFKNPWPSADNPTWNELLQLSFPISWYPKHEDHHDHIREVKVVKPDWGAASLESRGLQRGKDDCVVGTWLGHAGVLVEFTAHVTASSTGSQGGSSGSTYLVFDPIFSARAGPTPYTGPARLKDNPCKISDFPGCDAVFISHNHYDHLDLGTMTDILKNFPHAMWFVPMGNKGWFTATGIKGENVVELDWWDNWEGQLGESSTHKSTRKSKERRDNVPSFKVSCVPAQHTSGRAGWDKDTTLWSGWVIERFVTSTEELSSTPQKTRRGAVYHAGDTGYRRTTKSDIICPAFSEIGTKFGGFDLSFIPIWRGGSLGFISYVGLRLSHHDMPTALHCSPRDAINIHRDVKSKNTVGIHFGTFIGSTTESYDALVEFWEARKELGVKELDDEVGGESGRAGTVDIGGSLAAKVE